MSLYPQIPGINEEEKERNRMPSITDMNEKTSAQIRIYLICDSLRDQYFIDVFFNKETSQKGINI